MMLLISLFVQIYLKMNVVRQVKKEHCLLNASQPWEWINECMIFIVWDWVLNRINGWCCWLGFFTKYTW